MRKYFKNLFVPVLLFSAACAQMRAPTGGVADEIPPEPIGFYPPIFSTYFTEDHFIIEFNEFVKLDDLANQLIVSPPLEKQPTSLMRGKRLFISWEDTLKANTTYLFNFGSGIVDLNEGNPAEGLIYVFSTGSYIDSLEYAGNILQAFTNDPAESMSVMLYEGAHDSLPKTAQPNYFALTDEQGYFRMSYIKEGDYKLFAVQDENRNYKYDGISEAIAFDSSRIVPTNIDSLYRWKQYFSFNEKDTAQFIDNTSTTDYGRVIMKFHQPVSDLNLKFVSDNKDNAGEEFNYYRFTSEKQDSIVAWVYGLGETENINILSSEGGNETDTTYWYREVDEKYSKKASLGLSNNLKSSYLDIGKNLEFSIANPLQSFQQENLLLTEDSIPVEPNIIFSDSLKRYFAVEYNYKPEKSYQLVIPDSTIKDIYGASHDSLVLSFRQQEESYYGNLFVNLKLDSVSASQVVVQLISEKGAVIKENILQNSEQIAYRLLLPAAYRVKVIFDDNMNGKWDSGNYATKTQPENVDWLQTEITIRSNWDVEQDWYPQRPGTY